MIEPLNIAATGMRTHSEAEAADIDERCRKEGAGIPAPYSAALPLSALQFTLLNPRCVEHSELEALARSMGSPDSMTLAQYPAVEEFAPGSYRVIYGARRVAAAPLAGWTHIPCLVYPPLDPLVAHGLRLRENLHRQALDPLQEAAALRISHLMANADALDLGSLARAILAREEPLADKVQPLLALLRDAGWSETRPAVTWQQVLDELGLDLEPSARRRRLRILNLDPELHAPLQQLGLTESAVRALGAMQPEQQQTLIAEIRQDPALARKVRRISRVVRSKKYTLDEALDEAQASRRRAASGARSAGSGAADRHASSLESADQEENDESEGHDAAGDEEIYPAVKRRTNSQPDGVHAGSTEASPRTQAAVTELLEIANRLADVLNTLRLANGDAPLSSLPAPWGDYGRTALQLIGATLLENGV